ncbi:fatty acyl-CoA hydrolase precursor, medium chain-like [Mantella aurantiaca]
MPALPSHPITDNLSRTIQNRLLQQRIMGSLVRIIVLGSLTLGSLTLGSLTLGSLVPVTGEDAGKPQVTTRYGTLRGKTVTVKETDKTAHVFYGIPFAKPPVGPLRFAAPQPPEPWTAVREATEYPPLCVQDQKILHDQLMAFNSTSPTMPVSEDCLFLNVYTPANRKKNHTLPVMVFIHGGGLRMWGASLYEGSMMSAMEDIVMVPIQYRLGMLGFLRSEDGRVSGNFGFLDQVAALRWVQDNIRDFGGDPGLVTIFGESEGGVSVAALVLSPLARGLFHRAIAESGSAIIPHILTCKSGNLTTIQNSVAQASSCDPSSLLECLREKSEDEIKAVADSLGHRMYPGVVDGKFLPRCAEEMLSRKEVAPVPFMMGVTNHEFGWTLAKEVNISGLEDGMNKEYVRWALRNIPVVEVPSDAIPHVMEEYFSDTEDPLEIRDRFLDLCGDLVYIVPALRTANFHRDSGSPVYFYEFQHRPSLFKGTEPDSVKAEHGDELYYVFGSPFLRDDFLYSTPATEEEKPLSRTVMRYWANFARHGDPNGPGLSPWPRYNQTEEYLQIALKQSAARRLRAEKLKFWAETLPRILGGGSKGKAEH